MTFVIFVSLDRYQLVHVTARGELQVYVTEIYSIYQ